MKEERPDVAASGRFPSSTVHNRFKAGEVVALRAARHQTAVVGSGEAAAFSLVAVNQACYMSGPHCPSRAHLPTLLTKADVVTKCSYTLDQWW